MRSIFTTVAPAVVVLVGFWIGVWWIQRRRRRRYPADLGSVKPGWLHANDYSRQGDDRQAK